MGDAAGSSGSGAPSGSHGAAADVKVEAQSCPHCASGEAVPEGASWANPALACALFVADVRALATARRAEASSAKTTLSRRLQKTSPSGSGMASYASRQGGGSYSYTSVSRRGSDDARARKAPPDFRWGAAHAVAPSPAENADRATLVQPLTGGLEGTPGPPLPPLDHKPQAPRTGALAPVTVTGPTVVRAPSPSLQFHKEALGRSPSPVPRGYDI